jgi:hypothetical protein
MRHCNMKLDNRRFHTLTNGAGEKHQTTKRSTFTGLQQKQ